MPRRDGTGPDGNNPGMGQGRMNGKCRRGNNSLNSNDASDNHNNYQNRGNSNGQGKGMNGGKCRRMNNQGNKSN